VLESGDTIAIANFRVGFSIGATNGALEARDTSLVHAKEIVKRILARSGVDVEDGSSDRALNAIFEAPEEDTASFVVDVQDGAPKREEKIPENEPEGAGIEDLVPGEDAQLPVGPVDPLLEGDAVGKDTNEIPRPKSPGKGDMGLIVVGAVIVIAAVAGLVYLFS
jgi:hypothetical protein